MKKVLVLICVLSLMLSFVSCSNESSNGSADNTSANSTTSIIDSENVTLDRPVIPNDTNFDGYEFRILTEYGHAGEVNEVAVEESSADKLDDAVYRRNKIVENLLNITIKSPVSDGKAVDYIRKTSMAGDIPFDAFDLKDHSNITLLKEGYLVDLHSIQTLDLSKEWWDQALINEMSYKDKVYFAAGDINYFDDYSLMIIYFNKRLFSENQLEYPYETVRQGKWTFDIFSQLIRGFTRDLDSNGLLDQNDLWGMCENYAAPYHFMLGAGEPIVSVDKNGIPSLNVLSERSLTVAQALNDLFSDKQSCLIAGLSVMPGITDTYADGIDKTFRDGRALMYANMIGMISGFRDMDDDFGLLPQPKFDDKQDSYYTFTSGGWAYSYSIPFVNDDAMISNAGLVLNTMAGYSSDTVQTALVETALKSKYTRDDESAEMLNIMFKSKKYDWAERYEIGIFNLYANKLMTIGSSKLVSSIDKEWAASQSQIDALIETLDDL
ncbi:hypothetical protein FACS1894105_11160 [Clostridia bacterium]|nr:hypothetical protein FACS1894105_11160 [Clostridia bacterium]